MEGVGALPGHRVAAVCRAGVTVITGGRPVALMLPITGCVYGAWIIIVTAGAGRHVGVQTAKIWVTARSARARIRRTVHIGARNTDPGVTAVVHSA